MKKLVMLAAMLALLVAVAVPAIAQVSQELGNENESGNVDLSFSVLSSGNNSNQCVTPLQFGNTGSNQNAQGFTSFDSPVDTNGFFDDFGFFFPDVFGTDVDLEGGTFEFAPVLSGGCTQQVQQSSAASSF